MLQTRTLQNPDVAKPGCCKPGRCKPLQNPDVANPDVANRLQTRTLQTVANPGRCPLRQYVHIPLPRISADLVTVGCAMMPNKNLQTVTIAEYHMIASQYRQAEAEAEKVANKIKQRFPLRTPKGWDDSTFGAIQD